MTNTSLVLVGLLVLSFLIGRGLRQFNTPSFLFSGFIYLLVGIASGPYIGTGILSEEILIRFQPLVALLLGIVGFVLGLRVRNLMREGETSMAGALSALCVFLLVSTCCAVFISNIVPIADSELYWDGQFDVFGFYILDLHITKMHLWLSLAIGAAASSASLMNLGLAGLQAGEVKGVRKVLSLLAPSAQVVAVVLLGMALSASRALSASEQLGITVIEWTVASTLSGIVCGILFSLFIGRESDEKRVFLSSLGAIIFASGVGASLGISAIFVNFIFGLTVGLFSHHAKDLKRVLLRLEEPVFVLLLVIGGATWNPSWDMVWFLPLIYFCCRFLGFYLFTGWFYSSLSRDRTYQRVGQGLLGQDLIVVAIALSFVQRFPQWSHVMLTTVLTGIFLNDLVAHVLLKKVISDNQYSDDIQPGVEI